MNAWWRMNAWSHLPNAPLIDWVLESLRTDPKNWDAAFDATWNDASPAAWNAAWNAAFDATLNADLDAAWNAARNAAWNATRDAGWDAARDAARDVILALVAYDDCDHYLQMSHEQLLAWATLSEKPQAFLLLPLKWIQEHETLVTSA